MTTDDYTAEVSRDTSMDYRVRNDELLELVEQWRQRAENNRAVGQRHDANQIDNCADDLEEVLEEA